MSQKIRREQILEILQKRRFVTVRYLVETLDYSSATINRDLNAMEVLHLVKRSYGGVELALNTETHNAETNLIHKNSP